MRRRWIGIACALGSLGTAALSPAAAQGPPYYGPMDRAAQFRLGGYFLEAEGGLWEANEAVFTLDGSDFDGVAAGFSYVHSASNYLDIGVNIDFIGETVLSSDRDFREEGTNGLILHDTELAVVPLTADVRFLPLGRYRMRGERRVLKPVPYVGVGLGFNFWEYEEVGDFVDDSDPFFPEIYFDRYKDSGAAFEVHALAGIELPVAPRFNVLIEGRRSWSEADPDESYAELFLAPESTDLDLDASSLYAGVSFRF
jgi:hypothetical protein